MLQIPATDKVMDEIRSQRPYMPGYGILGPDQGSGLLPWSWAEERLAVSHNYWVATVSPGEHPHQMPVWGVWHETCVWFSSSSDSRRARNLARRPTCSVATDDAFEPVVVEGLAERVTDPSAIVGFAELVDAKYSTDYGPGFYDPEVNSTFRVPPVVVFGLSVEDFIGSPTRWTFPNRSR